MGCSNKPRLKQGHVHGMDKPRKTKKRPCAICRRWFQPNPRVAHSQKTCGPDCSKVLTQRRQAAWRSQNPDYDQDRRLRAKVRQAEQPGATLAVIPHSEPSARLPWSLVQTAFGAERAVILAFALRLHQQGSQTAFRVKIGTTRRSQAPLPQQGAQTAMEGGP